MALLKLHKVISTLPGTLDADAAYIVRTGAGFDLYVTDTTGSVAYALNGGGGSVAWGDITGDLIDQTDLLAALDAKQDDLVSGTNIKTINGSSLLGSGDLVISGGAAFVEENPVFTYSSGLLSQIDYDSTNYKEFTYDINNRLTQIDYVQITPTVKTDRKTFAYNLDGTLASITDTEL